MNQSGGIWKLDGRRMYEVSEVHQVFLTQEITITRTTCPMEKRRTEDYTKHIILFE